MGLADDLDAASRRLGGHRLKVDQLLDLLNGDDREALHRALLDPERVPANELARVLRQNGHDVSASAVKRWRERDAR